MVKEFLHNMFGLYRAGFDLPVKVPKNVLRREDFSKLLFNLNLNKGAEIGVQSGKNSRNLCTNHPNIELLCIDPWWTEDAVSKAFGKEKKEKFYRMALRNLEPFNVTIMRMTSMEAIKQVDDRSLDFVYIDGCHEYEYVIDDLAEWSRKVKVDGFMAGHDYSMKEGPGVIQAVNEYTQAHGIDEWFVTGNRYPSFFWANI